LKLDTNIFCCLMRVVVVILHKSIRGGLNWDKFMSRLNS
jgi:hypothetical protein